MKLPQDQQAVIYRKLTMFLDNELTKEAELELLKEIKTNPAYREILDKERNFREFIRAKVQRRTASPSLVESLKEKLRKA
ncbi:MAG: hypothetical protein R2879_12550 [Saprospiraceae bacterium]